MGVKRRIPYGVINWAEVVHECHFVDNTPEGRCDFLAVPRPGVGKPALLKSPGWTDPVEVVVVEVNSSTGYRWLPIRN